MSYENFSLDPVNYYDYALIELDTYKDLEANFGSFGYEFDWTPDTPNDSNSTNILNLSLIGLAVDPINMNGKGYYKMI